MNRINALCSAKKRRISNIFVTAGYPDLNSTVQTVLELEKAGADMVEIGMPFSDPLADGPTIQLASSKALENGMHLDLLFEQLLEIREQSEIPIVLMGYANPVLRYGLEAFLEKCVECGVDGLIIPDISLEEYERNYQSIFEAYDVPMTFLFTPKTSTDRLQKMEKLSKTFLYFVSTSATTGSSSSFSSSQIESFKEVAGRKLSVPVLMGFGIHNRETFDVACSHFNGAIVGSAFIRALEKDVPISHFMQALT